MSTFIVAAVCLIVGGTAGVLVMALCFMARDRGDE